MSKMPMVVEYTKVMEDGVLAEIKPIGVRFCCLDMAHHYRMGRIEFGQRKEECYRNKIAEVFIRVDKGAQVLYDESACNKPQETKPNTDIALPYCPFCREPIMTHEVNLDTFGFKP